MSIRVKRTFVNATVSQQTTMIQLPDIPAVVVEVRRVIWLLSSFDATSALATILDHNVNEAVTLSTTEDRDSMWFPGHNAYDVDGFGVQANIEYSPPYDLIGKQRFDYLASGGNLSGMLVILYTLRREPNKTLWNELRGRTSFERD